jgi:hypothetical protein
MKKAKVRAASVKESSNKSVAAKKSAARSARTRSSSQRVVTARTKADQDDPVLRALTGLVEISVQIRELLVQIRNALVKSEKAEPEGVDTVVITEAEGPQPSEDET